MGGGFPALSIFQHLLALMNAKYTFFQRKCVRHFDGHAPEQTPNTLSYAARTPLEQALFGEYCDQHYQGGRAMHTYFYK